MYSSFDGARAVSSSRRRASTDNSIGFDYQNNHTIDDDILSRIRSLLLSRNGQRPPLTPHTSEENPGRFPREYTPTPFDFTTAKSIAKFAIRESDKAKPGMTRSLSKSADMATDRRPSQPAHPSINVVRPVLRTSSSVNDMRGPYDSAPLREAAAARLPSSTSGRHKKSWFPKLVLRDAKKPETSIKSRVEISKYVPPNDLELHQEELACCPPCVPPEPHESKYAAAHRVWPGRELMAEPADLVCFLAGCPPGHINCKKQHRIPSDASRRSTQEDSQEDLRSSVRSRTAGWARKSAERKVSHPEFCVLEQRASSNFEPKEGHANGTSNCNNTPKFHLSVEDVGDFTNNPSLVLIPSSPRSSITSTDKFPHALQSLNAVANEYQPVPFSTSIATNFSLPGPKAKPANTKDSPKLTRRLSRALPGPTVNSIPWKDLVDDQISGDEDEAPNLTKALSKDPVRSRDGNVVQVAISSRLSENSLRGSPKTPSLQSGASKKSAYRHLLLKASVSEVETVDAGLPIPPVLSTTVGVSEISMPTPGDLPARKLSEATTAHEAQSTAEPKTQPEKQDFEDVSDYIAGLNMEDVSITHSLCQKEADLFLHIKERTREAKERFQLSVANDGGNSTLGSGSNGLVTPGPVVDTGALRSPTASSRAAYWGFVPTVKEVVHDAVTVAVRNVVSEAVIPQGSEKEKVTRAYRRAVAESLTEAAKDADVYLRRPSLWKESEQEPWTPPERLLKPCYRHSCVNDPHAGLVHCNTGLCAHGRNPEPRPEVLAPAYTWRGNDCVICPPLADSKAPGGSYLEVPQTEITIPRDLKSQVPLEPASQKPNKNRAATKKASRALRKSAALPFNGIPDRASSRQHVSKPKKPETKRTPEPRSQRRSYERLGSGSHNALRSKSSVGSLNEVAKQDQPKEPLLPRKTEGSDADSLSFFPSNERLGHKNTVHWLRDILSSTGPYEPRFTALPPRTRRGQESSETKMRAQTAPSIPVKHLYLETTPESHNPVTKQSPTTPSPKQDPLIPEALTKTINELEDLLSEALIITRNATDVGEPKWHKNLESAKKEDAKKVLPRASRKSDEVSLIGSIHESMRSFSGSSDGSSDEDEITYDQIRAGGVSILQEPALREHPSGWPPTGRVSTPYPPNTQPPSTNSVTVDIVDVDQITPSTETENSSLIRRVDPRLKSIEVNLRAVAPLSFRSGHKKDCSIEFQNLDPFDGKRLNVNQKGIESYSPGRRSPAKTLGESDAVVPRSLGNPPVPLVVDRSGTISPVPMPKITPRNSKAVPRSTKAVCRRGHSKEEHDVLKQELTDKPATSKLEKQSRPVKDITSKPLATGRTFSRQDVDQNKTGSSSHKSPQSFTHSRGPWSQELRQMQIRTPYSHSLDGTQFTRSEEVDFEHEYGHTQRGEPGGPVTRTETAIVRERETEIVREREIELRDVPSPNLPITTSRQKHAVLNLKNKRHVSLRDHRGFSLARSHKRQSIARDWSPGRKRFCAAVACLSTALVGILVGIYAGETPAIQYWIVDFHHYTVLGNVFFFTGLSIPTFLFWPLPLLHGRKPYILGAMSLAMPLLFPQALAVGELRSPYTHVWRVALILPRALMGFCLGFANMNFKGVLTDLFGASLQSTNPHQEHVDEFDVRRHGGGMGVWLGLWTWSAMGSIGVGFLIGAAIINNLSPAWGFYISITIIAFILLLNVLTPEVRRSAFRRSVAEVKNGGEVSRRLARGEVKMHLVQTGPKWWGEEFHYGVKLSIKMLKQPGFMVMAAYVAWMYGQIVLIVLLLGSLCSNTYKFQSPHVGLAVASVPLGAFVAIPFQKASLFSRDRNHAPVSDDDTYKKKVKWSSHFIRRAIFVLTLPFAGLGYTLSSGGAHIPFIVPILFAALIGFLSNLAMAECHGIIMETYDTSDLQPGMTGRSRGSAGGKAASKRTNYSSFPRVSSAFGITQGLGYLIGAVASGVGGALTRNLGQQAASGVMAFILLVLSVLLLGILIRFKDVQIIPDSKKHEMDRYHNARRTSGNIGEEPWRPIIIGNPHHSTRRMCILELGSMSRFSEIRLKNRLVDEQSLEALHPNHQMMIDVKQKIKEKESEMVHHVRRSLSRASSRGSRMSMFSDEGGRAAAGIPEQGDLGGHREMGRMKSEKGKAPKRRATGIRE